MFIRFVGAEIDERSHVSAGLFCAASQLRWSGGLPDYEFDALTELKDWFNVHLASPFDHLSRARRYEKRCAGSNRRRANILSERGS